jgi:hypothetical protein
MHWRAGTGGATGLGGAEVQGFVLQRQQVQVVSQKVAKNFFLTWLEIRFWHVPGQCLVSWHYWQDGEALSSLCAQLYALLFSFWKSTEHAVRLFANW